VSVNQVTTGIDVPMLDGDTHHSLRSGVS